jgi:hypothetical protein
METKTMSETELTPHEYEDFATKNEIKVPIDYDTAVALMNIIRCWEDRKDQGWIAVAKWSDENLWPAVYGWV